MLVKTPLVNDNMTALRQTIAINVPTARGLLALATILLLLLLVFFCLFVLVVGTFKKQNASL